MVFPSVRHGDDTERACETFLDLDRITGTVFRVYDYGTYERDSDDAAGIHSFRENCRLWVAMSHDGGQTFPSRVDITGIVEREYPEYATPMVSCSHLEVLSTGQLVIPAIVWMAEGNVGSPKGLCCACMLVGEWHADTSAVDWELGQAVPIHERGQAVEGSESSVVQLSDGKLLCVIRQGGGSGWVKPYSVSDDGGRSWAESRPLGYASGDVVISPSSCCRLWRHSAGRIFLIANIRQQRDDAGQRNALHIVEIDDRRLHAKRETLTVIDERKGGENPGLALSNFAVYEDRQTAEIVVMCPRVFAHSDSVDDSIGMRYRVGLD